MTAFLLSFRGPMLLAFLVRIAYFATADGVGFTDPLIDADYNDALGEALSRGEGFPPGPFWQPPLYPTLLGALYAIFGHSLWAPRLLQAFLGAATAGMASVIAERLGGHRWMGLVAGILVALHGPLVFYDGELLATSVATFLATFAVWLCTFPSPGWAIALLAGLAVGLGALAVAPVLLLAIPVAWSLSKRSRRLGAIALAGCALAVVPVASVNRVRSGEWFLISANAGVNFWIGNNSDIDRTIAIRPGNEWEELMDEPRAHGATSAGAQDAYFIEKAIRGCAATPAICLLNFAYKGRLLLSAHEIPRNESLALARQSAPVLWILTARAGSFELPSALLVPLAIAGAVVVARRRERLEWTVLASAIALGVPLIVFFVTGRYRAPLWPMGCVLAALGVVSLGLGEQRKQALAPVIGATVAFLIAVWPVHLAVDGIDFEAEMHYALAGRRARQGDEAGAVDALRGALSRRPSYLEAGFNLGLLLERRGHPDEAATAYREVLAHHPSDVATRLRLGGALLALGRRDEASALFQKLLSENPQNGMAAGGLARVRISEGALDDAQGLIRIAERAFGPRDPDVQALRRELERAKR
jgi:4-amino-4-deoxy-L-arabinose transferase-like glycosyltransferase